MLDKISDPSQLNYPSFSMVFGNIRVVQYTRVLTNVVAAGFVYEVTINVPMMVVLK